LPVRREADDQHDVVSGAKITEAVHDEAIKDVEAPPRFFLDALQFRLRHAGVVLEREGGYGRAGRFAAHEPGKRYHGPHVGSALRKARRLCRSVEILGLYTNSQALLRVNRP
jgi:hypothetical protein